MVDLIKKIRENLINNDKIIIAIDGGCASGKTTLSKKLAEIYDANVIHMDDFFLPFEMRTEERMKEIGGNFDYCRFKKEVADMLGISQSYISRIEKKILGRLKKELIKEDV